MESGWPISDAIARAGHDLACLQNSAAGVLLRRDMDKW